MNNLLAFRLLERSRVIRGVRGKHHLLSLRTHARLRRDLKFITNFTCARNTHARPHHKTSMNDTPMWASYSAYILCFTMLHTCMSPLSLSPLLTCIHFRPLPHSTCLHHYNIMFSQATNNNTLAVQHTLMHFQKTHSSTAANIGGDELHHDANEFFSKTENIVEEYPFQGKPLFPLLLFYLILCFFHLSLISLLFWFFAFILLDHILMII